MCILGCEQSQGAEALHWPRRAQVKELLQPPYQIAAQNSWVHGVGAYTGEIAPELLTDLGVTWVILGHSERRAIMGESNALVRAFSSTPVTRTDTD